MFLIIGMYKAPYYPGRGGGGGGIKFRFQGN